MNSLPPAFFIHRKICKEGWPFNHSYLEAIFETIFGSERRFRHDWANGSLLGVKRKWQDANDNGSETSDEDEDG
ncbi:hypothetical protein RMATCC62417_15929 [Rhizopus microsporus]|nr:hypothetical protein RMATCC62417_15929 [Rhizopus microsporus]